MSELKINLKEFDKMMLNIVVKTKLLRTEDAEIQKWIVTLADKLESFRVQVLLLDPCQPVPAGHFKFLKHMKDQIVADLDAKTLEKLGLNPMFERVALRRWLVAIGHFLEDIGDHTIAGPLAAPADSVQASKSESLVNNAV